MGAVIALIVVSLIIGAVAGKCMSKHKYGYKGGYGEKHKMMMEKHKGADMEDATEEMIEVVAE